MIISSKKGYYVDVKKQRHLQEPVMEEVVGNNDDNIF
jgi:hypothetical protein